MDADLEIKINEIVPVNLSWWKKILYRRLGKPAFLVGERWEIEFTFHNLRPETYSGCDVAIQVEWPSSKLTDHYDFTIPEIPGRESTEPYRYNFGLIEAGYGLIKLYYEKGPMFPKLKIGERVQTFTNVHIESVFAQNLEEFYQFWAMILATIGLLYIVFEKYIGPFLHWIMIFLFLIELADRVRMKP